MPEMRHIAARDATFQTFETLKRNREKRHRTDTFFLEGVHPIEQAIAARYVFQAFAYEQGARMSGWAVDMMRRARAPVHYSLAPGLLAELSDREDPCELIALVTMRTYKIEDLRLPPNPLLLAFDRSQSPGNLGSVIRTCDALGANALLMTGHSADPYDPQSIRASVGAVFSLPILSFESADKVAEALPALGNPYIVGTSARGARDISQCDLTRPLLLCVGNETFGLSAAWKQRSNVLARVPMGGVCSSMNVACAASICLYEAVRQRAAQT